eukprot:3437059-Rhodomonas_salina.2
MLAAPRDGVLRDGVLSSGMVLRARYWTSDTGLAWVLRQSGVLSYVIAQNSSHLHIPVWPILSVWWYYKPLRFSTVLTVLRVLVPQTRTFQYGAY